MTEDLSKIEFKEHPGYRGCFTDNEALGCWRNGTRIKKCASEPDDATPTGTGGKVLGSINVPGKGAFYFVEWDDRPGYAVGVMAPKISHEDQSPLQTQ